MCDEDDTCTLDSEVTALAMEADDCYTADIESGQLDDEDLQRDVKHEPDESERMCTDVEVWLLSFSFSDTSN